VQDSFSTAELISICYRHSNTSSCIAGQDQGSAVAIFLTCMSVRVCRPELLKKSLSKSCFRRPPLLFRTTPRLPSPGNRRANAVQMWRAAAAAAGTWNLQRSHARRCKYRPGSHARWETAAQSDSKTTHQTDARTDSTVRLAADADTCF